MSKPFWISDHLYLSRADSAFLSFGVRSGLIQTGAWNDVILVRAWVTSVDRRNFIIIGLGQEASNFHLLLSLRERYLGLWTSTVAYVSIQRDWFEVQ